MKPSKKIRSGAAIILFLAVTGIIIYFPPVALSLVITLIVLVACTGFLVTSLFSNYTRSALAGLFLLLFLGMNVFVGFQILNTILLLCFIIGVDRLYTSFK